MMNDWTVAVTTAPRKDCTLLQCISTLRTCGWEPLVFAEPGSTVCDAETIQNDQRLGCWFNWLNSVRWVLDNTNTNLVLTVQDDSTFHPDSKCFVESILWPSEDAGFVSLYTPASYSVKDNRLLPRGTNRIVTRSLWGACALVWDRRVLSQVIDTAIVKKWVGALPKENIRSVLQNRRDNPSMIANSDTAIGKAINSLGRSMWFVDPSLVYHAAEYSTINHGGNTGDRNALRLAELDKPLRDQIPIRDRYSLVIR